MSINYTINKPITVHRDQDQEVPLYGALEKGCKYIEFDLRLSEDGELLVGHDIGERNKTIEKVYLNPLLNLYEAGSLGDELMLLVDIKTAAKKLFFALQNVLKNYSSMLTTYHEDTGLTQRKVRVIITGNRDKTAIAEARPRLAFYDGRVGDLSGLLDTNFMPIISDKWSNILYPRWLQGIDYFFNYNNVVKEKIEDKVAITSQANIAFRTWAMPEDENTWEILSPLKDRGFVYNTDYPDRLVKFFDQATSKEKEEEDSLVMQFLHSCP